MYCWLWCSVIITCWRSEFLLAVHNKTLWDKSNKALEASLWIFLHSPVANSPNTSCYVLCTCRVSFEVPATASSRPDTDLCTPVHLPLIHPPLPHQPLSPCFSPPPVRPIPGCCPTGGKLGLTGGQAVSQAHRREHCLSPLISSSVPSYLNLTALNLSPLRGRGTSCHAARFPFYDKLFKQSLFSWLPGSVLMYVRMFMLNVRIELWNNRLWKEISQGVRIKDAFTCLRAVWKCLPSSSCWEAFMKNISVMDWARLNAISCILR